MARTPRQGNKDGKQSGKSRAVTAEDDTALWQRVAETVNPLKSNRVIKKTVKTEGTISENSSPPKRVRQTITDTRQSNKEAASRPRPNDLTHGTAAGVDKRTNQRLIRGKTPIEGRLDLHGHTKESAHRALDAFIKGSFAAERRCVIVITGKGLRLESGEIGVLRQAVPQWLNSPALRPMVLAYSHATPKDGGEGALYVLLKRKR